MELTREITIDGYNIIIDKDDYNIITANKWYVQRRDLYKNKVYFINSIYRNGKNDNITLHRLIMGCTKGDNKIIDHINGNTLDNRKCNLRVCTNAENTRNQKLSRRNKSGYKGVIYRKHAKKYYARIIMEQKEVSLGYYNDPVEAARKYDIAAIVLHGDFAFTNFDKSIYKESDIMNFKSAIMKDRETRSDG